jgi:type III secretion system FlhB-like substrate exporter
MQRHRRSDAMNVFGWSYPPGCSGTPFDRDDGISELQDKVLELLEEAGIPINVNDQIIKLISDAEIAAAPIEADEYYEHG